MTTEIAAMCFGRVVFEEKFAHKELKLGLLLVMNGSA
jgi:hypothetical protein